MARQARMNPAMRWVDDRLHISGVVDAALSHPVPKRVHPLDYLGESTLFVFINQMITGILLAMFYNASAQSAYAFDPATGKAAPTIAWTSIQHIMSSAVPAGSLIRSMHYWGNYFMVVLVFAHMLRGFYVGAYKYPRELTWLTGVALLLVTLGFAFTGYLLPWDQKAYWATQVGVNIGASAPILGPTIGLLLRGGPTLNGDTLTRFFAIHMLVLPALIVTLIGVHILLTNIQGVSEADGLVLEGEETVIHGGGRK
ncbi:MAG: cytochrome b subunit of the bc complex [Chloroflexi bacterium]|jgi:ubiquinol-cytochrome c reductase cytochrome b subunit|nr:cytochrome b subunit of the bc complex [Chloroflexota bacterium]